MTIGDSHREPILRIVVAAGVLGCYGFGVAVDCSLCMLHDMLFSLLFILTNSTHIITPKKYINLQIINDINTWLFINYANKQTQNT